MTHRSHHGLIAGALALAVADYYRPRGPVIRVTDAMHPDDEPTLKRRQAEAHARRIAVDVTPRPRRLTEADERALAAADAKRQRRAAKAIKAQGGQE